MPTYKSLRVEKPVYDSLIALQRPRETISELILRLVVFFNTMSEAEKRPLPIAKEEKK